MDCITLLFEMNGYKSTYHLPWVLFMIDSKKILTMNSHRLSFSGHMLLSITLKASVKERTVGK